MLSIFKSFFTKKIGVMHWHQITATVLWSRYQVLKLKGAGEIRKRRIFESCMISRKNGERQNTPAYQVLCSRKVRKTLLLSPLKWWMMSGKHLFYIFNLEPESFYLLSTERSCTWEWLLGTTAVSKANGNNYINYLIL